MLNLGSAIGYLMLDTTNFTSGFKSALNDLRTFGDSTATAQDKMSALSSAMGTMGGVLTKGLTLPLVGVGAAAMSVGNKFESQMARVKAISRATDEDFNLLKETAQELGRTTAFSATEAAQGMESLASAGFTTSEIVSAMPGLLDLTAASQLELGDVAGITASAIRSFGMEASDATHVADVFALASSTTKAQVDSLGEAMKYVAPVANAMGLKIEETTAAIGIMSDAGIEGSQAGTALKTSLLRLTDATPEMTSLMNELGISFFTTEGKMLDMKGIVEQLQTGLQGLTEQEQSAALTTLFGQEAVAGMLTLIEAGPEKLEALTTSFENADGAAKAMADIMQDTVEGKFALFNSAVEAAANAIHDALEPAMKSILETLANVVSKFAELDQSTINLIVGIGAFVAALGPVLLIGSKITGFIASIMGIAGQISGFIALCGGIGPALAAVGSAIASVAAPVGIAIAAIAALVAAWQTDFAGIQGYTQQAFSAISSIIGSVMGAIQSVIGAALSVISSLWNNNFLGIQQLVTFFATYLSGTFESIFAIISGVLTAISQLLQGDFSGAWQTITEMLGTVFGNIQQTFEAFFAWVGEAWSQIWTGISEFFQGIWNGIVEFFSGIVTSIIEFFTVTLPEGFNAALEFLSQLPTRIIEFFQQLPGNILSIVTTILSSFASWVGEMIGKAIELGSQVLSSIIEFFAQLPERIGYFIGFALGKFVSWVAEMIVKAIEVGSQVLASIIEFFTQLPGKIWEFVSSALQNFVQWVADMIDKAFEVGEEVLNTIVEFFTDLPGKILEFITDAYENFTSWVEDMIEKGTDGAADTVEAIIDGFTDLPGTLLGIGKDAVQGLWEGISGMAGWIQEKAAGFAKNVVAGFKQGLDAHSPARKMIPVGEFVVQGLNVGMERLAKSAIKTAGGIAGDVVDAFDSITESATILAGDNAQNRESIEAVEQQAEGYGSLADNIAKGVKSLKTLYQVQKDGATEGIKDSISNVVEVVQGSLLGKLVPVGAMAIKGLEIGMKEAAGDATETANEIAQDIADTTEIIEENQDYLNTGGSAEEQHASLESLREQDSLYKALSESIFACVNALHLFYTEQKAIAQSRQFFDNILACAEGMQTIKQGITGNLPVNPSASRESGMSTEQVSTLTNAIVGALSVSTIGALAGDLNISIPVDGVEFYRATLQDFRRVQKENPEIM